MTVTVLLIIACGYSAFVGQLLNWHIEQEPRLYGWCIFAYVAAVAFALCAVVELILGIVRLARRRKSSGGSVHIYKRKRR